MNKDTFCSLYYRAIALDISDDLIKDFKDNFSTFKRVYRKKYISARDLADLDQQEDQGEFIINDLIL